MRVLLSWNLHCPKLRSQHPAQVPLACRTKQSRKGNRNTSPKCQYTGQNLIKCRKTDLGKILWKSRKEGLHLIRLKSPMLGALREEVVPGLLYFIPVTQEVLSGHLLHKCTREKLTVFLEDGQTSDRWKWQDWVSETCSLLFTQTASCGRALGLFICTSWQCFSMTPGTVKI